MMTKTLLGFLLFFTVSGYSQKGKNNQIQVLANEKIIGKSLLDSTSIVGTEYIFGERIDQSYIDAANGFLTVQLRGLSKNGKWLKGTGDVVQYDLEKQTVLWSKKITYQTGNIQHFSSNIIENVANKSYYIDTKTGKDRWEVKNNIFFVDTSDKIGIGYKSKGLSISNELEGIDLADGKVLWKRKVNREYGWNDMLYTNDSTMIAVTGGLHSINVKTGEGWDYETVTGKNDYTSTIATNAVAIGLGLLTGNVMLSTGHDVVRDLVSNTIIDSSNIYFASKEQLASLDKISGQLLWKTLLPPDLTSKSTIFVEKNVIYMINEGRAFIGNRQINFGKPYVAAFEKDSGKQLFLSFLDLKDDPILSFQVKDEEIFLVFKNKIRKYSMSTGSILAERDFAKEDVGDLGYFIGDQVFKSNDDGDLINLLKSDTTKVFVYTTQNKTLAIDINLKIAETYDLEKLSIYYLQTKDLKFIAKDQKTIIIDTDGTRIAEIDATSTAYIIDNILYNQLENSFLKIDLNLIIQKQ